MKNLFVSAIFASLMLVSPGINAAEKTIRISVPGMTCASCPYIVRQSILNIEGIKTVAATMEDRSATVTFDDEVTNIGEITAATANVGYPSSLIKKISES
jgi:mercuric ion binding protein